MPEFTKRDPSEFDSYTAAPDDEPLFTLRATDPLAPALVELWQILSEQQVERQAPEVVDAGEAAQAMRRFRNARGLDPIPDRVPDPPPDIPTEDELRDLGILPQLEPT